MFIGTTCLMTKISLHCEFQVGIRHTPGSPTSRRMPMGGKANVRRNSELLKELWADAYDCWINPPGREEKPLYSCPQIQTGRDGQCSDMGEGTNEWPQAVRELKLPIFGLSAANPRGEERSDEENKAASEKRENDLGDLERQNEGEETSCWWYGFSFGIKHQEKGFVVSTKRSNAIALATKYEQGAVYEFVFLTEQQSVVLRKTIPVLVPEVEADVRMITCPKPPLDTSSAK